MISPLFHGLQRFAEVASTFPFRPLFPAMIRPPLHRRAPRRLRRKAAPWNPFRLDTTFKPKLEEPTEAGQDPVKVCEKSITINGLQLNV